MTRCDLCGDPFATDEELVIHVAQEEIREFVLDEGDGEPDYSAPSMKAVKA